MSPEQCRCEPADERSDVYSLGITYFALLTGRPPFDAATPTQLMFAHCTRPTPDPRVLVADLPAACAAAVLRATAKDPVERFQTAYEFLAALPQASDFPPFGATPISMTIRSAPPVPTERPDPVEAEAEDDPLPIRRRPAPNRRQWVKAAVVGGVTIPAVAVGISAWRSWSAGGRGSVGGPPVSPPTTRTTAGQPFDPNLPANGLGLQFGATVAAVAFSADGTLLAAGGEKSGAVVWAVGTGKPVRRLDWGDVQTLAFWWSEGVFRGPALLGGGGRRGPLWWTRANDGDGHYFSDGWTEGWGIVGAAATQGRIRMAFGHCGDNLSGMTICYVEGRGETCRIGQRGWSPVRHLRYAASESDPTLAILRHNGGVHLWDSDTGKQLAQVVPGPGDDPATAADAAFHPDGKLLAVAVGGRVRFWDRAGGRFQGQTEPLGNGQVTSIAYSPDGKTLAVGDSTGAAHLYENGGTAPARTLSGEGAVRSLAFRPLGALWLACGAADGTVRLWDLANLPR